MITLAILGQTGPFPRRLAPAEISKVDMNGWEGLAFLVETAVFANAHGRPEIVRALKRAIGRHDRLTALKHFDLGVLNGLLHWIRRRIRPYAMRAGLTDGRHDLDL